MPKCFALIDVNAFYCSSEILFKPWLRHKPVVVCSNNDGCIVARNDHAKALGIKMGQPIFELREMIERQQVHIFSSNYALYQTISDRIMAIIAERAADVYVYSIDESFVALDGIDQPEMWARQTQDIILKRVGMPVGVGIGPTKTLAKLANWAAKKWKKKTGCVVDLMDQQKQEKLLRYAPVGEVWGVGSKTAKKLNHLGIMTAWDLAICDPKRIRKYLNVNVERTARELAGIACFPLCEDATKKQMIACTRSFGTKVTRQEQLHEVIGSFVVNASEKLRRQQSLCTCLQVFIRTSGFTDHLRSYARSVLVQTPYPTADTRILNECAQQGLKAIYREGFAYAKAGIVLMHLVDVQGLTKDLFNQGDEPKTTKLMNLLDGINAQMGRGTVRMARDIGIKPWSMRQEFLSQSYMNAWNELNKVKME